MKYPTADASLFSDIVYDKQSRGAMESNDNYYYCKVGT